MENKKIKGATPTQALGYNFRSQLEARIAKELLDNNIQFEYEKLRLELIPSFKYKDIYYRAVHYTPDFVCDNIIIECKGFPNDSWSLKKKVIIKYLENTNYEFYEVHNLRDIRKIINKIKYNMEEIWKRIEEFPDYEISNFGNVISSKGRSRRAIKSFSNPEGYKFVYLYKDNKKHPIQVHRLVASYFVDNPNNLEYVNHIDESKSNNICSNLEWCSSSYNRQYGSTETRRIKTLSSKYSIGQYSTNGELVQVYNNAREAAKALGKSNSSGISNCVSGISKTAYGFIWRKYNGTSRENEELNKVLTKE